MATRNTASIPRIILERQPPMVRCTFAQTLDDRWEGIHGSCGSLIPFNPQHPCPDCGQKQIRAHAEAPGPGSRVIDGSAMIVDQASGEVVALQWLGAADIANSLARHLKKVHWHDPVNEKINNSGRLSGLRVTHRVFGYTPPAEMRKRYGCSTSSFNKEYPEAFEKVEHFTLLAEWVFRTFAPDVHEATGAAVRRSIPDDWRIAGTLWTSGIINNTAALPMHKDSSNVKDSWSAMLSARSNMGGGMLYLADYDTYLAVPNGSISIFDGQSVVHGVTPLTSTGPDPYRYTLVSYSKAAMRRCASCRGDEAKRAAVAATAAEDARIRGRR
jgi:hypothetical protein